MSGGEKISAKKMIAWGAGAILGGFGIYKLVDSVTSVQRERELEEARRAAAVLAEARRNLALRREELERAQELDAELDPEPAPTPRRARKSSTTRPKPRPDARQETGSTGSVADVEGREEYAWIYKAMQDVKEKKDALDAEDE